MVRTNKSYECQINACHQVIAERDETILALWKEVDCLNRVVKILSIAVSFPSVDPFVSADKKFAEIEKKRLAGG